MTPNIPPSYVLIPKYYKPTRRSNNHPMLFRQRLCPRSQNLQSYKTRAVQHLVAQNIINKLFYIFDESEKKQNIDNLLKKDPNIWNIALSNEIGRLAQGIRDINGNDAIDFIAKNRIPKNKRLHMPI